MLGRTENRLSPLPSWERARVRVRFRQSADTYSA